MCSVLKYFKTMVYDVFMMWGLDPIEVNVTPYFTLRTVYQPLQKNSALKPESPKESILVVKT